VTEALWRIEDLLAATGGAAEGDRVAGINGVSIDTRTILAGDLFVALKDQRDGHDFVTPAFAKGAAAALVNQLYRRKAGDGLLIRVDDVLKALQQLAAAARARLQASARVVAVTGSAGKTTTKEMLRACFAAIGRTHASEKSYNNHWGVPLTLARMPADTAFAVIEIGMNHPGEIRPLSKLARPHVALVTTVAPAHLGHFRSVEEIAEAKAEIFEGVVAGGVMIVPRDSEFAPLLAARAAAALAAGSGGSFALDGITGFGTGEAAETRLLADRLVLRPAGSRIELRAAGRDIGFDLPLPGRHNALNAAAVIAAFTAALRGIEPARCDAALAAVGTALAELRLAPEGRGQVHELAGITLLDESYNANPASMRAALATLALYPRERRRIAVLGDMLELGTDAAAIHAALAAAIADNGVDLLFACGPNMRHLFDAVAAERRGGYAADAAALQPLVIEALQPGDVAMVKASNGSRLAPLVKAVRERLAAAPAE
jgi:UDP-N-acetylmuramoyl-tripeptide--D-alanyl-D-alanine ligase